MMFRCSTLKTAFLAVIILVSVAQTVYAQCPVGTEARDDGTGTNTLMCLPVPYKGVDDWFPRYGRGFTNTDTPVWQQAQDVPRNWADALQTRQESFFLFPAEPNPIATISAGQPVVLGPRQNIGGCWNTFNCYDRQFVASAESAGWVMSKVLEYQSPVPTSGLQWPTGRTTGAAYGGAGYGYVPDVGVVEMDSFLKGQTSAKSGLYEYWRTGFSEGQENANKLEFQKGYNTARMFVDLQAPYYAESNFDYVLGGW